MSAMPSLRVRSPEARDADALEILIVAARAAGALALPFFRTGAKTTAAIHTKAGGSPVTDADLLADEFLRARLTAAFPQAGWLSEESADDPARLACDAVLIVDPIDGTRAFIAGDPRWTVCVALMRRGRPVAGVVHAPALDETYAAHVDGGAFLNGRHIHVSAGASAGGARIAGPHFLLEAMRKRGFDFAAQPKIPSLAYRLVLVAGGALEAGLASGKAHDWDIAAADLIVREAGGLFATLDGATPVYNRPEPIHPKLIASAPAHGAAIARAAREAAAALAAQGRA